MRENNYLKLCFIGKKDLPSYGIEDQFSKSEYLKNVSDRTRYGLHEKRIPGVYTPRKVKLLKITLALLSVTDQECRFRFPPSRQAIILL